MISSYLLVRQGHRWDPGAAASGKPRLGRSKLRSAYDSMVVCIQNYGIGLNYPPLVNEATRLGRW